MARVQNTQQYAVRVEGLGLIEPGEIVDVPQDVADSLTCQEGNWQAVKPSKKGSE